jgi:hypothetical protein
VQRTPFAGRARAGISLAISHVTVVAACLRSRNRCVVFGSQNALPASARLEQRRTPFEFAVSESVNQSAIFNVTQLPVLCKPSRAIFIVESLLFQISDT